MTEWEEEGGGGRDTQERVTYACPLTKTKGEKIIHKTVDLVNVICYTLCGAHISALVKQNSDPR